MNIELFIRPARLSLILGAVSGLLAALSAGASVYPVEILKEEARFTNNLNSTSEDYDGFGSEVALDGVNAAVLTSQAIDLFRLENDTWRPLGELQPTVPGNSLYMSSMDLDQGTLIVGAPSYGNSGHILVFDQVPGPGLNAWNITDFNSAAGFINYGVDVPPEMDASARTNGWRFFTRSRFLGDRQSSFSMSYIYGDGVTRYGFYWDFNNSDGWVVGLLGATPVEFLLSQGQASINAYHDHEMVFDPQTQMVTYYFDGVPIHTWAGQSQVNNGIFFGGSSTAGQGAMNVNQVHFEILQTGEVLADYDAGTPETGPAPDPTTRGWTQNGVSSAVSNVGSVSPDLSTVWPLMQAVQHPSPNDGVGLGTMVALDGDVMVSINPYGSEGGGVALVFARQNGSWSFQQELFPSNQESGEVFGASVDVEGNLIAIGAYEGACTTCARGRVFVYERTGETWTERTILLAGDRAPGDGFGSAVGISGDRIAVGARWDDRPGNLYAGSVYVFKNTGTAWLEEGKASPLNPSDEGFGSTLAIDGDTLLVGGFYYAAHFLYSWNGTAWVEVDRRDYSDSSDPALGDVELEGERFMVGSGGTEGHTGAVYIYNTDYRNASGVADYVRKQLYFDAAQSSGTFDPDATVFRYKKLLYANDGGIRARHEMIEDFYGADERVRAATLQQTLIQSLSYNPYDFALGDLLLDINYDRAVAETILTKNLRERVERARFGAPIAPPSDAGGFIIDNEIPLLVSLLHSNRFAMQGYFDLLKQELLVVQDAEEAVRWATQVLAFSSQWSPQDPPDWHAIQALGEPDTYPNYGDFTTAWASETPDDQREFLALGYNNAAPAEAVRIYETLAPGAVDTVSIRNAISGQWEVVWTGSATVQPAAARIFEVAFPRTAYPVDAVRLDLDSPAVLNWNEIDAVGLFGGEAGDPVPDETFGLRLFQSHVPGRALMAATYDNGGSDVSVVTNPVLFDGYKDLVLLFDLLGDQGLYAVELSRLLIGRDGPGDRDQAGSLVGDTEKFLWLQGRLLLGIFAGLAADEDDPSGLNEAIARWERSLTDLATVQQSLTGRANVLGFDRDFLMFVQKFEGQSGDVFDSYGAFKARLDPTGSSNPLRTALNRLADARGSYADYRGYEDQVAGQLVGSTVTYRDRLRDIVGVFPDSDEYSDDPTAHPGSELDQQFRSIELARLRVLKNKREIENLRRQVQIEMNKAADVSSTIIDYGSKQVRLTLKIGDINAAQAAANQLTDYFNPENLLSGASIAIALNFGVQTISELEKAKLEGEKERLAALERATIVGIESAAVVKTLLLSMNTLAVDSMEAALLLVQEANRLAALYREKAQLEQELDERDAALTQRFFADPVHRLRSQTDMVRANFAFEQGQKWLFFMARALEFKWNILMRDYLYDGRRWSTSSIFKLRNAEELETFYEAMDDFESQLQLPKDDYFDWFSVRDDFFGYALTDSEGQPSLYEDPVTGQLVDGIQAFRSRLRQLEDNGIIRLEFSTVRETPGSTFFRGPRFNDQGNVVSKGLFLDKIRWMKINLPGSHSLGRSQLAGSLQYGGTSFVRNFNVGQFDPNRADRLRNEMTAYSTRFWHFDPFVNQWKHTEALTSTVTMQLSQDSRVPPMVQELEVFKERSVAASGWVLTIPTEDLGTEVMDIDELDDVEIYFYHYAVTRP